MQIVDCHKGALYPKYRLFLDADMFGYGKGLGRSYKPLGLYLELVGTTLAG